MIGRINTPEAQAYQRKQDLIGCVNSVLKWLSWDWGHLPLEEQLNRFHCVTSNIILNNCSEQELQLIMEQLEELHNQERTYGFKKPTPSIASCSESVEKEK